MFLLFFTFLACFGIFGAEGMRRLAWPVISLMSSASLNGVFLQRWDILLIGFLEFSLFLSVGEGVFYGGVLAGELAGPKRQKMNRKFIDGRRCRRLAAVPGNERVSGGAALGRGGVLSGLRPPPSGCGPVDEPGRKKEETSGKRERWGWRFSV